MYHVDYQVLSSLLVVPYAPLDIRRFLPPFFCLQLVEQISYILMFEEVLKGNINCVKLQ